MTKLKLALISLLSISALFWIFLNRDWNNSASEPLAEPPHQLQSELNTERPLRLPDFQIAGLMSPEGPVSPTPAHSYSLVPFWASWCYPCWEELSSLNQVQKQMVELLDMDLIPIGVSMDGDQIQLAQKKWNELGLDLPLNYEIESFYEKLYKIERLPYTILIENQSLKVVAEFKEALPKDPQLLMKSLEASLELGSE